MNCATDFCRQGRDRCPTPWTCGKHEQQANYERVINAPIQPQQSAEAADIPPWTLTGFMALAPSWALVLLIVALLAALLFWPGLYEHWPRMVSALSIE